MTVCPRAFPVAIFPHNFALTGGAHAIPHPVDFSWIHHCNAWRTSCTCPEPSCFTIGRGEYAEHSFSHAANSRRERWRAPFAPALSKNTTIPTLHSLGYLKGPIPTRRTTSLTQVETSAVAFVRSKCAVEDNVEISTSDESRIGDE